MSDATCWGTGRRTAGARKIAESIWRLMHWGVCFDAAKPFGGIPAQVR